MHGPNSRSSMLAGARNGRHFSEARTSSLACTHAWVGLSIRGVRSFGHVLTVTKWLHTIHPAIKRRRKSLVTTGEAMIKRS